MVVALLGILSGKAGTLVLHNITSLSHWKPQRSGFHLLFLPDPHLLYSGSSSLPPPALLPCLFHRGIALFHGLTLTPYPYLPNSPLSSCSPLSATIMKRRALAPGGRPSSTGSYLDSLRLPRSGHDQTRHQPTEPSAQQPPHLWSTHILLWPSIRTLSLGYKQQTLWISPLPNLKYDHSESHLWEIWNHLPCTSSSLWPFPSFTILQYCSLGQEKNISFTSLYKICQLRIWDQK